MFTELKQLEFLKLKFYECVTWFNKYLNTKGHDQYVDAKIRKFEIEVMEPLDRLAAGKGV